MTATSGEDGEAARTDDTSRPGGAGLRLLRAGHGEVIKGSVWFVANVAVTAVGGFGYWSLAAHFSSNETVGLASTLFAALLFVNYATSMGLPVAVARFCVGNTRHANTLYNWALAFTATTAVVGGAAFLVAAQSPTLFRPEAHDALFGLSPVGGAAIFIGLVTGQSLAVLVEVRLVTLRLWHWVLARVVLVATLRIPLLYVHALSANPLGLLIIMAGLPALSGVVGVLLLRRATPLPLRGGFRDLPPDAPLALQFSMVNYAGLLAAWGPQYLLPIIVNQRVSSTENASFYLAWTVTSVVFLVPHTIAQVVLAEGSRDEDRLAHLARARHQVRTGLVLAVGVMGGLAVGAAVLAGPGTRLAFGERYDDTATILPRLVAAGVPWAVTSICLAYARMRHHSAGTVVITAGFALCTIVPCTALVGTRGISGAADGWLIGNVVAAVIAVLATLSVSRRARGDLVPSPPPQPAR